MEKREHPIFYNRPFILCYRGIIPPPLHFPLKICDPDDNQTLSTPPPPSLPFSPAANKDWSQKQAGFKLDIKVSTFLVYDSIT